MGSLDLKFVRVAITKGGNTKAEMVPSGVLSAVILFLLLTTNVVFGTALSAGQREDFRRRQATQRQRAKQARKRYQQSGPTFYLRPNSFSDLTFQEFAARYTGMGQLGGK